MALYFYHMQGVQPADGSRLESHTRQVAASGYYAQSRFITTPEDYELAVLKLEEAFQQKYPGAYNHILTAFNRLD